MMSEDHIENNQNKRNNKVIIIIVIISLLLILLSLKIIFFPSRTVVIKKVYAGIEGAVIDGGVYEISDDTRIYELIMLAKGLHKRADIRHLDVDEKVIPWKVYCIPYLPKEKIHKIIPPKVSPIKKAELEAKAKLKTKISPKKINFVYAGLPRTYLLVSFYPDLNYITTIHIPWYTLATSELEYPRTLYEIYLTGGIPFLLSGVQRITGETIDHYFTQSRPSWMHFINYLGGIKIDIPEDFAHEYHIQPGVQEINGLLAWEFIRYISKYSRLHDSWVNSSVHRIAMQQEFMASLYGKFKNMNVINQGEIIKKVISDAETDMKLNDVIKLAFDMNQLQGTTKDFLTLSGTIQKFDERAMLVSSADNFQIQRRKLLYKEYSKQLQFKEDKKDGFGGKK